LVVQSIRDAFAGDTDLILLPLEAHMHRLAEGERFEEAAEMRNRAGAIARIVGRQRRIEMLDQIVHLVVKDRRGATIEIRSGGVVDSAVLERNAPRHEVDDASTADPMTDPEHRPQSLDEALCVASWLQRNADGVRVLTSEGQFASPLPGLPDFKPAAQPSSRPNR
jgi:DNA polymerase-3 subunit epsilon